MNTSQQSNHSTISVGDTVRWHITRKVVKFAKVIKVTPKFIGIEYIDRSGERVCRDVRRDEITEMTE